MEHFLRVCIQILFMRINANMQTDIITLDQRAYGYKYRLQYTETMVGTRFERIEEIKQRMNKR